MDFTSAREVVIESFDGGAVDSLLWWSIDASIYTSIESLGRLLVTIHPYRSTKVWHAAYVDLG